MNEPESNLDDVEQEFGDLNNCDVFFFSDCDDRPMYELTFELTDTNKLHLEALFYEFDKLHKWVGEQLIRLKIKCPFKLCLKIDGREHGVDPDEQFLLIGQDNYYIEIIGVGDAIIRSKEWYDRPA